MMRAAKKDSNHNDVKRIFEANGITVKDVHQLKEFCDMVVTYRKINELIEVKDGNKKLTPAEEKFHKSWPTEVHIIRSAVDAYNFIEWIKVKARMILH